jgi:hypothetical protein
VHTTTEERSTMGWDRHTEESPHRDERLVLDVDACGFTFDFRPFPPARMLLEGGDLPACHGDRPQPTVPMFKTAPFPKGRESSSDCSSLPTFTTWGDDFLFSLQRNPPENSLSESPPPSNTCKESSTLLHRPWQSTTFGRSQQESRPQTQNHKPTSPAFCPHDHNDRVQKW